MRFKKRIDLGKCIAALSNGQLLELTSLVNPIFTHTLALFCKYNFCVSHIYLPYPNIYNECIKMFYYFFIEMYARIF